MPKLILHEHPDQSGQCLSSLVEYAQRIPLRFSTLDETAAYLRSRPFEPDPGLVESAVPVPDYQFSRCSPWQRQRIWPDSFNCWEATAHWLAHALKLLRSDEVIDIWDRTIGKNTRHVWPTIKRQDGIWLVTLEGRQTGRRANGISANIGWEDVFGALHVAGAGTLGFFLGADRAAPIVREAEKLWGGNIAEWAKTGKEAAAAGQSIAKYSKYISQSQKNTVEAPAAKERSDTNGEHENHSSGMRYTDI